MSNLESLLSFLQPQETLTEQNNEGIASQEKFTWNKRSRETRGFPYSKTTRFAHGHIWFLISMCFYRTHSFAKIKQWLAYVYKAHLQSFPQSIWAFDQMVCCIFVQLHPGSAKTNGCRALGCEAWFANIIEYRRCCTRWDDQIQNLLYFISFHL